MLYLQSPEFGAEQVDQLLRVFFPQLLGPELGIKHASNKIDIPANILPASFLICKVEIIVLPVVKIIWNNVTFHTL